MLEFTAYFYKTHAMIEGAGQFKTNEILLAYLEYKFPDLHELLDKCKQYERRLHYPETREEAKGFDDLAQKAIMFFNRLDRIIESLPPYARYLKKKMTQAEFREWADYALELRQRAYDKELSFEDYETEIRK